MATKPKAVVRQFDELGVTGLQRSGNRGWVMEEFLRDLTGERARKIYREMRDNDAVIGAMFFAIEMMTRNVDWRVEGEDNEQVDFVESCIGDMSHTFEDFLSEVLSMLTFGFCIPPDQTILMGDGTCKKIKEVKVGDLVLSKYGRPKKVLHTFERHHSGELLNFKTVGYGLPVKMTPEHIVLTSRGWIQAKEIQPGDLMFRPRYQLTEGGSYLDGWLVGAYLAEGHRDTKRTRVTYSVHQNETGELTAYLSEWIARNELETHHHLSKLEPCVFNCKDNLGAHVSFSHPVFRQLIDRWVPENTNSHTKHLRELPREKEFAKGVLDGWVWGDGSQMGETEKEGSSVSADLVHQMHMIGAAVGLPSHLKFNKGGDISRIRGEEMVTPDHYSVRTSPQKRMIFKGTAENRSEAKALRESGRTIAGIAEELGVSYVTSWKWLHGTEPKVQGLQCEVFDKLVAHRVLKIEKEQYDGDVYDLEVEDDHSFCTGSLIVSNSWHEVIYKRRNGTSGRDPGQFSRFKDGKIGWRKFPIRAQESLQDWVWDDEGGIRAFVQSAPPDYKVIEIPIERSLLFRVGLNKNSPEGRSFLRNCYTSYYYKKRIQEIEAIGIERDLAGMPVIYRDGRIADKYDDELKKIVKNVRRDEQEGIVLPLAYDEKGNKLITFELMSSGGSRQIDVSAVIDRYSRQMAMTVLADFIFLGQQTVGSFALASSKTELFATGLGAILKSIASVMNRIAIPRLLEINGMDTETPPQLIPGDIESPDLKEIGAFITSLAGAGAPLFPDKELEDHLRAMADLPKSPEESAAIPNPASQASLLPGRQTPLDQEPAPRSQAAPPSKGESKPGEELITPPAPRNAPQPTGKRLSKKQRAIQQVLWEHEATE